MGYVAAPWQLHAAFVCMGLGYATMSVIGLSATIAPWFEKYQGQAVAMALAKHGVIGLTRTAALEYATRGIRVNAVCPGSIDTPMAQSLTGGDPKVLAELVKDEPIGRLGQPEALFKDFASWH